MGFIVRYHIKELVLIALSSGMLLGCSLHPLPEDISRDDTFRITEKIRCEARDALVAELIGVLDDSKVAKTKEVARLIRSGILSLKDLTPSMLDEATLAILDRYRYATMAFKFVLTITESNDNTANAGFAMPFTNGKFSLALKAGSEKERQSQRTIELSNSFQDLVVGPKQPRVDRDLFCDDHRARNANFAYPVTGKIGMDEVVHTYSKYVNTTEQTITFTDKLIFTTKLLAEVKPSVELSKVVPNQLRLVSADATSLADRTDKHEVTVTIVDVRKEVIAPEVQKVDLGSGVALLIPKIKRVYGARPPTQKRRSKRDRRRPSAKIFSLPPEVNTMLNQKALQELRRQDSLDRQSDVNSLIGR